MKINFLVTGEGSSDLRLVAHIENILINEGFTEVRGEAPDLSLFQTPIGRTVREKLTVLAKYYPSADVIFVHRDADGAGIPAREREITDSALNIFEMDRIIPIIPSKMLETWLLADHTAIKRVAGNGSHAVNLGCVPATHLLENIPDAKKILLEALCEASQIQGARLKKFKNRFPEMRARLTCDLDSNGPINQLNSYKQFRKNINIFSQRKLGMD